MNFLVSPVESEPPLTSDKAATDQASGCRMSGATSDGMNGGLVLMATLLSLLGIVRWRRRPARFTLMASGVVGLSASLLLGAGCKGAGTNDDGNKDPGMPHPELAPFDEIGRYQSAAIRDGKILISAYDSTMGDLAFTSVGFDEATTAKLAWLPVDGLPSGSPSNKSKDAYRGETVKAVVVLRAEARARHAQPEEVIAWAQQHMAAYKVPRIVEFIDALPKSGSGKVMWRALQEREQAKG